MTRKICSLSLLITLFIALQIVFCADVSAAFNYEDVTQKIHYEDPYVVYNSPNPLIHETKALGEDKNIRVYIFADLNERFTNKFFTDIYPTVVNKLGDKVIFIYRHHLFNVDFKNSLKTATYGECLSIQDQFWPYLSVLSQNSRNLSPQLFSKNINFDQFTDCIKDPNTISAIQDQSDFSKRSGFIGIPTFIIENASDSKSLAIKIDGVHDASFYERAVNEIITEQNEKNRIKDLEKQLSEAKKPWFEKLSNSIKRFFDNLRKR